MNNWICSRCKKPRHEGLGRPPSTSAVITEMAARPSGVDLDEAHVGTGVANRSSVRASVSYLMAEGKIHGEPGRRIGRRYFATAQAAAQFAAARPPRAKKPQKSRAKPKHLHKKRGVKPGTPSPKKKAAKVKHGPALTVITQAKPRAVPKPAGPAIVPPGLVVQRLPSHPGYDVRYQLPPGDRVVGGFASMGVGRYLDSMA